MKKVKPENILYGIIITALLIGALIGSLITLGVISAKDAFAAPAEEEVKAAAVIMEKAKPAVQIDRVEPIPAPESEKETAVVAAAEEKIADHHVGICEITAYCTCVKCCGIWSQEHPSRQGTGYVQKTATGTIPTEGRTVAVDPNVIPLGSVVMINGVGYIAEDTGSAVSGKVVDIYFADHNAAVAFGRQTADVSYIK